MADEPGAPVPMFTEAVQAMSPAEATAALAKMQAELHPPPDPNPTDSQGARQLLDKLTKDASWAKALVNGDPATYKQFSDLNKLVADGDTTGDAIAGIQEQAEPIFEFTSGTLPRRDIASTVNDFIAQGLDPGSIRQAMSGATVSPQEHRAAAALQAARMANPVWVKAVLEGDFAATREFKLLSIVLSSTIAGT
jgi:hypothetical protein